MGGEERAGAVPGSGGGGALLVGEGFGVGQSGVPVDGRVQVDVPGFDAGAFGPLDRAVGAAVLAVGTPATAVELVTFLAYVSRVSRLVDVAGEAAGVWTSHRPTVAGETRCPS